MPPSSYSLPRSFFTTKRSKLKSPKENVHEMTLLITILVTLVILTSSVAEDVIQLHIIHRHGARKSIDKHPTDPSQEEEDPLLYTEGIHQLNKLGATVREYIASGDKNFRGISLSTIQDSDILSYSSNLRRTQISARAFLRGLYEDESDQVPTLVFASEEEDWLIRGYASCPALAKKIKQFTESNQFQDKKKDYGPTLRGYGEKIGFRSEQLEYEDIFDIYDIYHVIKNGYTASNEYGNAQELSDDQFKRLREEADWVESNKFKFSTHQIHVAGGLIAHIVSKIEEDDVRIHHYSAHYPTLLTLLASVRDPIQPSESDDPANSIPEFGAALIIEVFGSSSSKNVRFLWYNGGDADNQKLREIVIGDSPCDDAKKGCSFEDFRDLQKDALLGVGDFCNTCTPSDGKLCGASGLGRNAIGIIGAVVGLSIGFVLVFLYLRFRKHKRNMESMAPPADMGSSEDIFA